MNRDSIANLLGTGMNPYIKKLNGRTLSTWARLIADSDGPSLLSPEEGPEAQQAGRTIWFLKSLVVRHFRGIRWLRRRQAEFLRAYSQAFSNEEKERHLLRLARDLRNGSRGARGDRRAMRRWLDQGAVIERAEKALHRLEFEVTLALDRLGVVAGLTVGERRSLHEQEERWQKLGLCEALKPLFEYEGDDRVRTGAFKCLSTALRALPEASQASNLDAETVQFVYRCAMHRRQNVWLQREALNLLQTVSPSSIATIIEDRLRKPAAADDIFVRKRAVEVLIANLHRNPDLYRLLSLAARDASPFVRQGFASALASAPGDAISPWLSQLAFQDSCPQVRAAAVLSAWKLRERRGFQGSGEAIIKRVLLREKDSFVVRVALHAAGEGYKAAESAVGADGWEARREVVACLEKLHREAEEVAVRRWAALSRERIWCEGHPEGRALAAQLRQALGQLRSGEHAWLPGSLVRPYSQELLGRVLSVLGQRDFPAEVELRRSRLRMNRGHVFRFRWWRVLHELRNPAPDKRQAFYHTVARWFRGGVRAPSSILGELAETKVPGEPLFVAEEGGWRPYLPLPDEFLSSVASFWRPKQFRVYSSEGVTTVEPPGTLTQALRAYMCMTWNFAHYARLRNWKSSWKDKPTIYLQSLTELGFVVRFNGHCLPGEEPASVDPAVQRFFPGFIAPFGIDLWKRLQDYCFSPDANGLVDLLVFAGGMSCLFVGRHLLANQSLRRARQALPLVVGGWGTRGKSGTERLKAALFNALGYGLVSKTTGCEAMFLYAHAFGKTQEMFLFRPYDKATIWEQANIVKLAVKLKADVFLWECMGLTPAYIDILQRQWMRDDLSTITNTYPDHEDIQGPAGFNIPEVMTLFIPERSRVLTAEELMLPILTEGAAAKKSSIGAVTWLEAGLLAPDVLKRFPYEEHPSNLALVLAVAEELGVERDFALKEIADRVVPDLGVLKTQPAARLRGRRLQFSNGMSANDRHGTISNWTRLGFHLQDPEKEPGVWITTVVNNRADRIPRSRIFARIIVEDISADRHFLIGGNLSGLMGYICEAWESYAAGISLWPQNASGSPEDILLREVRRFRQPSQAAHVVARLEAMLGEASARPEVVEAIRCLWRDADALKERLSHLGVGGTLDAVIRHLEDDTRALGEYEEFRDRLRTAAASDRARVDEDLRALLWKWYQRKLVVVHDYYITGDGLVALICDETPPGYLNRIMGIQNIKGTGLDFVYRWQAWDACHRTCELLESPGRAEAERGLRSLSSFREYGFLCEERVRETVQKVKASPLAQDESVQAELAMILSSLDAAMEQVREKAGKVNGRGGWVSSLLNGVEAFLDPGDCVRRRKTADRIYKDMVAERIGSERATVELKALTQRQKGGWLVKGFDALRSRMGRRVSRFVRSWKR